MVAEFGDSSNGTLDRNDFAFHGMYYEISSEGWTEHLNLSLWPPCTARNM
jgi:hypothetical protein